MAKIWIAIIFILTCAQSFGAPELSLDSQADADKAKLLKTILPRDQYRLSGEFSDPRMQSLYQAVTAGGGVVFNKSTPMQLVLFCSYLAQKGQSVAVALAASTILHWLVAPKANIKDIFQLGHCYSWCVHSTPGGNVEKLETQADSELYTGANSYRDKIKNELGEDGMRDLFGAIQRRVSIEDLFELIKARRDINKAPFSVDLIKSISSLTDLEFQARYFVEQLG